MLDEIADESDHDRIEARLRRFAQQLVRHHHADIKKVAAALEERQVMTSEEIDVLLPASFMAKPITWHWFLKLS